MLCVYRTGQTRSLVHPLVTVVTPTVIGLRPQVVTVLEIQDECFPESFLLDPIQVELRRCELLGSLLTSRSDRVQR
jgi:hypothetical protein